MSGTLDVASMSDEALDALVSQAIIQKSVTCSNNLWEAIEQADAVATANKQLEEAARCRRNNAEAEAARIKERILFHLQARDLKALPSSFGKFARQANGGHKPLRITGEFPDEFARIKREADLDKIRQAIKEGECLEFVEFIPVEDLPNKGEHLRLKS